MHLLLVGASLAAFPALEQGDAPDDTADDEEGLDLRELPAVRPERPDPRVWFGVTPPTFSKPWADPFQGAALGIEGNVRIATPVPWFQPELRLGYDQAFDFWNRVPFAGDAEAFLLVGPRFGLDQGPYGGVAGGLLWLHDGMIDANRASWHGAVSVYGGWAFRGGERMRWGPELSLGVRNTIALRLEWGA